MSQERFRDRSSLPPLADPTLSRPRGGVAAAEGGGEAGAAAGPARHGAGRHPGEPRTCPSLSSRGLLPAPDTALYFPPPQESTFQELCEGLLEESDGEGEPGQGEGPEAGDAQVCPTPARLAATEKKTEQQRRREKAARRLVSAWAGGACFGCLAPFLPSSHPWAVLGDVGSLPTPSPVCGVWFGLFGTLTAETHFPASSRRGSGLGWDGGPWRFCLTAEVRGGFCTADRGRWVAGLKLAAAGKALEALLT